VSFASLQMNRDLHFSASMYGFGAGLFFVSYALCEVPSNMLMVKFGAKRWLTRIMLTWGLIAIAMMLVRTPVQFYGMRLLLGMAEAGFFPGVVFYLTEWFPPEHRAKAISGFYIALPLSSTVMGSLAGWLLGLNGKFGLAGWQWLFLVEGLPPILLSLIFFLYLPDSPADAAWLTAEEREWLEARRVESHAGHAAGGNVWHDLKLAFTNLRLWMVALFFLCILTVLYAWSFSAPAILIGLTHRSAGEVGWMIAGMGLLGATGMVLVARSSDRTGERPWHIIIPCLLMAAGFLIGGPTSNPWLGTAMFALTVVAYNAAQGPVLTLPAAFLAGRSSAIGYAVITGVGVIGGFIGPAFMGWARDLTGSYQRGLLLLSVPSLGAAAFIYWMMKIEREQAKLDLDVLSAGLGLDIRKGRR
jgi:ACS family tartrate transporter-like MFS transporter